MAASSRFPESSDALIQSNYNDDQIPLTAVSTKPAKLPQNRDLGGQKLRRYYVRGLTAVLVPPTVTAYYLFIWLRYLNASPPDSQVFFGPRGGLWVYYSWFIIGVIGLGLSSYGFVGVEASMLMDRRWAVRDAMLMMGHGEHSWSGPGGWMRTARNMFRFRSKKFWSPSMLWLLLSFLSLLIFLALPLSGLVMNFGSGYVKSTENPLVVGFEYDNFNMRSGGDSEMGAALNWKYAFGAKIPGMGVIYSHPAVDRTQANSTYLQKLPNSLPVDDGASQIFLAPQAEVPVSGIMWGLSVTYNCSIVTSLSDFTILNDRDGSKQVSNVSNSLLYFTSNNDTVMIYNRTDQSNILNLGGWADNLEGVVEFGYSPFPKPYVYNPSFSTGCYYDAQPNVTGHYPGLDQQEVLETIFWQYLQPSDFFDPVPVYNTTISLTIDSLFGAYKSDSNQSMSAIGVRCLSSSAVGTADIDGMHSTFSNFQETDTPMYFQKERCAARFGPSAIVSLFDNTVQTSKNWLSTFFTSISAPPPFYASYGNEGDEGTGASVQLSMLQAPDLRNSLLRAYAAYAVQLMYNGGQGYSALEGSHGASFVNKNVTAFKADTVLQGGVVAPIFSAVLLGIWALGSVVLGVCYGFRRRWAPTLDGYSLFVFGLDMAKQVRQMGDLGATLEYEDSRILRRLPGLIGDLEPDTGNGRIGLVSRVNGIEAKKNRSYI